MSPINVNELSNGLKNVPRKRLLHIDIARGIAIILVIIGHSITDNYNIVNRTILSFHMPLFFVISGLLYSAKPEISKNEQIRKKAYSLLVPQITLGSIALLYDIAFAYYTGANLSSLNIIDCFTRWWFLLVQFEVQLILIIFPSLLGKNTSAFFTCILSLLFAALFQLVPGKFNNLILYISVIPMAMFFFSLGHLSKYIFLFYRNRIQLVLGFLCLIVCRLVAAHNEPVKMYTNSYGNLLLFLVTSILGSAGVLFVSKWIHLRFFKWCGENSIIIYVVQFHVILLTRFVCKKLFFNIYSNAIGAYYLLVIMFSTIIITILTFILKKYCPYCFGINVKNMRL